MVGTVETIQVNDNTGSSNFRKFCKEHLIGGILHKFLIFSEIGITRIPKFVLLIRSSVIYGVNLKSFDCI